MELETYVESVRDQLAAAAELGGPETLQLAERLAGSLESATRLALLDALSAAAAEITSELAPGSVELRLQGREPNFTVILPPVEAPADGTGTGSAPPPRPLPESDDSSLTRINLRLSTDLKDRVEEAAKDSGLSVNAWLVRAAAASLPGGRPADPGSWRGGERFTGWLR